MTKTKKKELPLVSVCTPTYNRRPFIPYMIKCFDNQDYPKDKIEWIIIDDGSDKIEDLVKDHANVKYYYYPEKMALGKKRNIMHEKSKGEIIVYMDDDDYYPKERISHAVEKLTSNPEVLCAGSSEIHIYFEHIDKIYQFGPYGKNHATAGTFAFKRALLENSYYEDDACLAEERTFLKNYTVPFIQLDPKKVILVFSHIHNTYDKKKLLQEPESDFMKPYTKYNIEELVPEKELRDFYKNRLNKDLSKYPLGDPKYKPDVLYNIIEIEEKRRKALEEQLKNAGRIIMNTPDGGKKTLNNDQVVSIISQQQTQIQNLYQQIKKISVDLGEKKTENKLLNQKLDETISNNLDLQRINTELIKKLHECNKK